MTQNLFLLSHWFPGVLSIFNLFHRQVFISYSVFGSVDRKGMKVSALNRFAVLWGDRDMDNSMVKWMLSRGEGTWKPEEGDCPHALLGINKPHPQPQRAVEEGVWRRRSPAKERQGAPQDEAVHSSQDCVGAAAAHKQDDRRGTRLSL